jgi:hypothetical protein
LENGKRVDCAGKHPQHFYYIPSVSIIQAVFTLKMGFLWQKTAKNAKKRKIPGRAGAAKQRAPDNGMPGYVIFH